MKSITCEKCLASLNLEQKQFSGGNIITCEYCGTTHVIQESDGISRDYAKLPGRFDVYLLEVMKTCFDLEGLELVCHDMVGLTGSRTYDYDNIAGRTLTGKCLELVQKCRRMGSTNELVNTCSKHSRKFAVEIDAYTG